MNKKFMIISIIVVLLIAIFLVFSLIIGNTPTKFVPADNANENSQNNFVDINLSDNDMPEIIVDDVDVENEYVELDSFFE
jgi:flagellar basal body-associated protein FliL